MYNDMTRKGLTLVEVLISTTIFVIGLGAMLTSAVAIFKTSRFTADFLIATHLAKEGVEAVINKRNENFLNNVSFRDGFDFGPGTTYALVKPDLSGATFRGAFVIDEASQDVDACIASDRSCLIYFDPNSHLYADSGMVTVLGAQVQPTQFYRVVEFNEILCAGLAATLCAGNANQVIGLEVDSVVKWRRGSSLKEVVVETALYDWE